MSAKKHKRHPKTTLRKVAKIQKDGQDKNTVLLSDASVWKKHLLIAGVIMLVTYCTFIPALDNDFTNWDDPKYILENHIIKDLSWERIKAIFLDEERKSGLYAPLTYISWAIEHYYYRLDPAPFHRDNVILHVLNTGLVCWFILLLVGRIDVAIITAILFGVHPLHVESVAWITERKDVLYAFFFLWSLILYVLYCARDKGRLKFYLGAFLLFVFALLSKPAAVTLPMILLLVDYFLGRPALKLSNENEAGFMKRLQLERSIVLEKLPFFALSLLWGWITINTTKSIAGEETFTILERTLFAFYGIVTYLYKVFIPLNLSCFYPYPTLHNDLLPTIYYIAPVISLLLVYVVVRSAKLTTTLVFGSLFFFFTIALVLQFFPVGPNIVTDRYTYVPYIGIFFILGQGYAWLNERQGKKYVLYKMLSTVVLTGFAAWCIFLSYERCDVWKNSETLWSDVISKYPNTSEGYLNRGQYYTDNDEFDKALVDYDATLQLNPKSTLAYINRGNVYGRRGIYDQALINYSKAIELSPKASKTYLNRGNVYGLQGDIPASIVDFTKAISLERNYLDAYINRAISYSKLRDFENAFKDFNIALQIDPSSLKTRSMRAYALLDFGKYNESIVDYNYLIQYMPNDPNNYFYRALANQRKNNFKGAILDYSKVLKFGINGAALLNRSVCYEALQDFSHAIQDANAAKNAGQNVSPEYLARLKAGSG